MYHDVSWAVLVGPICIMRSADALNLVLHRGCNFIEVSNPRGLEQTKYINSFSCFCCWAPLFGLFVPDLPECLPVYR